MTSSIDLLLIEASDPSTRPERLRELSEWEQPEYHARLRQSIAANPNPNADDDLLRNLATDHPREVVANPRFQLLQLSGEAYWEEWDLLSLCSLTLAAGNDSPPCLKAAMKS